MAEKAPGLMNTFRLDGFGDLPLARQQAYAFYKMQPMADGFPGKKTVAGDIVPHPIFGTYLIRDFLTVWERTKSPEALAAAKRVADAALAQMAPEGEALIFWYQDNGLLNHRGEVFYSGLTQSRYMVPMFDLSVATGDARYAKAAHGVFMSLMIPAADGGVMREFGSGAVIEEFPHEAPNFVLNGWTTAMLEVFKYGQVAGDKDALDFAEANMRALVELLPLYDVPDLANSRYRLSGHMQHRLRARQPFKVVSGQVRVGGETYPFHHEGHAKWVNLIQQQKPDVVQLESVLMRHLTPLVNVLDLVIESTAEQALDYYPRKSRYDPFSRLPADGWGEKRSFPMTKGKQTVSIRIPWADAPYIGEPTTFSKRVPEADGTTRQRNVYHWLHVSNLYALWQITNDDRLVKWIYRWFEYSKRWPDMEVYQREAIDYRPVGAFRLDVDLIEALAG